MNTLKSFVGAILLMAILVPSITYAQVTLANLSEENVEVNWVSWEDAIVLNEENPRKIIIDVYTSWCGWCKRMDATTFKDKKVVDYINENYYAIKMDGEYKNEIFFQDHTFKFVPNGRRGYHELPAALLDGKLSYPTTIFMNDKVQIMQRIPGYLDAETIMPILVYLAEDHFDTTSWEQFQKDYQAKVNP